MRTFFKTTNPAEEIVTLTSRGFFWSVCCFINLDARARFPRIHAAVIVVPVDEGLYFFVFLNINSFDINGIGVFPILFRFGDNLSIFVCNLCVFCIYLKGLSWENVSTCHKSGTVPSLDFPMTEYVGIRICSCKTAVSACICAVYVFVLISFSSTGSMISVNILNHDAIRAD